MYFYDAKGATDYVSKLIDSHYIEVKPYPSKPSGIEYRWYEGSKVLDILVGHKDGTAGSFKIHITDFTMGDYGISLQDYHVEDVTYTIDLPEGSPIEAFRPEYFSDELTKLQDELKQLQDDSDNYELTSDYKIKTNNALGEGKAAAPIILAADNLAIKINGGADSDMLQGTDVNEKIYGNAGADILFGAGGSDSIFGGDARDVLYGGLGADRLVGGAGNDIYEIDNLGDTVTEFIGADNGVADDVFAYVDFTLSDGVDNLVMLYGNQRYGTGNADDNIIYGNGQLNVLQGGAGYDTMIGGAGSDYYIINGGFGVDVIRDFVAGAGTQDAIVFSKTLFTNFAAVMANSAQMGADTWIGDGFGNTVVLSNVLKTNLHADDFQFA